SGFVAGLRGQVEQHKAALKVIRPFFCQTLPEVAGLCRHFGLNVGGGESPEEAAAVGVGEVVRAVGEAEKGVIALAFAIADKVAGPSQAQLDPVAAESLRVVKAGQRFFRLSLPLLKRREGHPDFRRPRLLLRVLAFQIPSSVFKRSLTR